MAKNEITHVYLNGRDIGTVDDPQKFVNEIRSARRTGVISGEINVAHYAKQHYININSDRGRVRKPYVILENGKSKLTKDVIEKLKSKEINFNYLFRNGIVEYLDAEEEENALVAFEEKDITPKHTHVEVDIASIFGFTVSTSPSSTSISGSIIPSSLSFE